MFFHSQVHPKDLFCKQVRKERGRLPLETKMLVIRKMEAGKKRAIVGSSLGLAPTTVSTTMAYAEKIKQSAHKTTKLRESNVSYTRNFNIEKKMEQLLTLWVDESNQKKNSSHSACHCCKG